MMHKCQWEQSMRIVSINANWLLQPFDGLFVLLQLSTGMSQVAENSLNYPTNSTARQIKSF